VSLRDKLETRLEAQRRQLAASKVKYIVIHRHRTGFPFDWHAEDGPEDQYPLTYKAVYDGPDLMVLRVY
jgi:hypothetical protein